MTQRNDQTLYLAQFGKNQRPGIAYVVGVKDMKNIAPAVLVTNCRRVFRARLAMGDATWRRCFALTMHDPDSPQNLFLNSILAKS